MDNTAERWAQRVRRLVLAGATLALLGACAMPIQTKVTNFNAWPADAAGARSR